MSNTQDIFISHSSLDKQDYILPLEHSLTARGVSFWLDTIEIGWGDNIVLKITEGLRSSRFVLLCLSKNFLSRRWAESEMSSVLAIQNSDGKRRALPLILNSKEEVLQAYPLLSALAFREYSMGVDAIAQELAMISKEPEKGDNLLEIIVESVHTGQLCNLKVSPKVSVKWLSSKAQAGLGVKEEADTGGFMPFRIRWILVDVRAEADWEKIPRNTKQEVYAAVKTGDEIQLSFDPSDRLETLSLPPRTTFHLYAIEDINYKPAVYAR